MSNPYRFKTINGWNTLFIPKPGAQTFNIRAVVNAGSTRETTPEQFGVAHFLEHMFFKGTETRDYTEINRKFAELGDVNAYTSRERTVFHLTSLPRKDKEAAEIFFDLFFRARMPDEEIEKERSVITEELQTSEDNPISWAMKRIGWDTWGQAAHPVIGTPESVSQLGIEDMWAFRKRWYTPENTLFAITGDLPESRVDELFSSSIVPSAPQSAGPMTVEPFCEFKTEHFQIDNPKSKQSLLLMIFPSVSDLEMRALRFGPDLATNLIGGGMHSVLFEHIRENLGLCYSIWMQYQTFCGSGYHSIFTLLDRSNVKTAYDASLAAIETLTRSIPDDLLEISRSNLLFDYSRSLETASGTAHIADSYFDMNRQLVPFQEYQDGIQSITKEEIRDFIGRYLFKPKVAVMNADLPFN